MFLSLIWGLSRVTLWTFLLASTSIIQSLLKFFQYVVLSIIGQQGQIVVTLLSPFDDLGKMLKKWEGALEPVQLNKRLPKWAVYIRRSVNYLNASYRSYSFFISCGEKFKRIFNLNTSTSWTHASSFKGRKENGKPCGHITNVTPSDLVINKTNHTKVQNLGLRISHRLEHSSGVKLKGYSTQSLGLRLSFGLQCQLLKLGLGRNHVQWKMTHYDHIAQGTPPDLENNKMSHNAVVSGSRISASYCTYSDIEFTIRYNRSWLVINWWAIPLYYMLDK